MYSIKKSSILLLILLNIFVITFMETISEDTCGEALAQWFHQVAKCGDRDHNNTQHIIEMDERIRLVEHKMDETLKTVVENQKFIQEMQKSILENQKSQIVLLNSCHKPNTIVIQRRMNGLEDFYRTWNDYKNGFGNATGDFFIGLEKLYKLTNNERHELRITLEDFHNDRRDAKYDNFVIGSEAEKYVLKSLGRYSGTAGDSLTYNLGMKFTTKDQDNDQDPNGNCAEQRMGAWWYNNCARNNPNGKYFHDGSEESLHSINWVEFKGAYPLKFVEIKIRKY